MLLGLSPSTSVAFCLFFFSFLNSEAKITYHGVVVVFKKVYQERKTNLRLRVRSSAMSVNTFNSVVEQKRRQNERDKHLACMTNAGLASPVSPDDSSVSSFSSQVSGAHQGIQSARDFLWDEGDDGEEDFTNKPPSPPTRDVENFEDEGSQGGGNNFGQPKVSMVKKARRAMKEFSKTGENGEIISMVRDDSSPQGFIEAGGMVGDAEFAAEEDVEEYSPSYVRKSLRSKNKKRKMRRCKCAAAIMAALLLLFVGFYSGRASENSPIGPGEGQLVPPIEPINTDSNRLKAIREKIIASGFTDGKGLDDDSSAQSKALYWVSYYDPFQMHQDSDSFLQRYALATFYFAANPRLNAESDMTASQKSLWNDDKNWMSDMGICMWYGVECPLRVHNGVETTTYNENIDIVGLELPDNNVHATIPLEMAALESLITLDLSYNAIGGTFPAFLSELEMLGESDFTFCKSSESCILRHGLTPVLRLLTIFYFSCILQRCCTLVTMTSPETFPPGLIIVRISIC